jgi:tRNA threonylcarbamoyl adenosine modification protein (Sua5/YciO/YrdC/YwlC family)
LLPTAAKYNNMILKIHPDNPEQRKIDQVIDCLRDGGVIIYPTDTVYGIGCDIYNQKAVERICRIRNIDRKKANFSFICYDLSHLSDFARNVDTATYKLMKKAFPGPFTFVLQAKNTVPDLFKSKKKTVGIRIPENNIAREIVNRLGNPIMSASVHDEDEVIEYTTNPELIHEKYEDMVDMVIDGGFGDNHVSTVIDCSNGSAEILRQGKGILEDLY